MAHLFFIMYFLAFSWLITRSTFILKTGIGKSWLIALFTIKVLCGTLYGYLYSRPGLILTSDTWQIYFESLKESRLLLQDPFGFFTGLFGNPDQLSYSGFSQSDTSYWNNLKDNLLIKAEAVMNVFSGGHYYTNVVIYSFLTCFGSVAFYRTLDRLYDGKRVLKIVAAFLVPSFLFWTSGMYKDGFLFLFMSLTIYQVNHCLERKKTGWKSMSIILISLVILFLLRFYVAFLLIPALAGWVISALLPNKTLLVFTVIYIIMAVFIGFSGQVSPAVDIPRIITSWQAAFLDLPANSAIPASRLEPSGRSLLKNGPQALARGFLRPFVWENKGLQYLPFALEIVAFVLLCLLFLLYREDPTPERRRFMYFCFFLAGSSWLLLGYTVNIIGALVRYKSIFYPLVIGPLVCAISWSRVYHIIKKRN